MIKMLYNRCKDIHKFENKYLPLAYKTQVEFRSHFREKCVLWSEIYGTYPQHIRCRSNLGHIFRGKKCVLCSEKYGNVAHILWLKYMAQVTLVPTINVLYFYIINYQSICIVPSIDIFYRFLMSYFPGKLFRYFLNHMEMVPAAPVITGFTFVVTFCV